MKKLLMVLMVAGLISCDNSGEITTELDTLTNRIENSATIDSIREKGKDIFDSVKSKGGRLVDKVENEIDDKDTTNRQ